MANQQDEIKYKEFSLEKIKSFSAVLSKVIDGDFSCLCELTGDNDLDEFVLKINRLISIHKGMFEKMEEKVKEAEDIRMELEEAKLILEIKVNAKTRALQELAENLEEKVKIRTKELQDKLKEIETSRVAVMNVLEDVEKEREKVVVESNKTLAIINNFTDGLFLFDERGRIALANPQSEKFFGVSFEEMKNKSVSELSEILNLKPLTDFIGDEIKDMFRKELKISDNLILEISTISVVREQETLGKLIIIHDVTREKTVEKLKTEFVSIAAHQLRTPLSAIKWTFKMVMDGDAGDVTNDQKEMLDKGFQSTERIIKLVNDLLDVARLEEGRYVYTLESNDLADVVQSVIDPYKEIIQNKGINFEFKKPDKEKLSVAVDVEKIKLAIENLLDNAIRYTPAGGKVVISLRRDKNQAEFSVKDSGIGIPKNQHHRIFSKFFRAPTAVTTETEGSGLGLFLVKNIIDTHNGRIWFESEENKGATFYFTLPIVAK